MEKYFENFPTPKNSDNDEDANEKIVKGMWKEWRMKKLQTEWKMQ